MNLQFNLPFTLTAQDQLPLTIDRVYTDDTFIVEQHRVSGHPAFEFRLVVHRRDKQPIGDWRTLQDAKNQTVGAEREAMQIFPRESVVTDTVNHYHLWVFRAGCSAQVGIETPERTEARRREEAAARKAYLAMLDVPEADRDE